MAAVAFLATLGGTLFHYIGVGAQTVDDDETDDEETRP